MTILRILVSTVFVMGCASQDLASTNTLTISKHTQIPTIIEPQKNMMHGIDTLRVPEELLKILTIKRQRVEVRKGPGTQYALFDQILEEGTKIIQTDRSGIWRKIFDPRTLTVGWVHNKTLRNYASKNQLITIKKKFLPKVFTSKKHLNAKAYMTNKRIHIKMPKSSPFYTLQRNRDKILVIVGQTESIVWLAKRDAL